MHNCNCNSNTRNVQNSTMNYNTTCSSINHNSSCPNTNTNTNIYANTMNTTGPFPINYMYGHAYTPNQIMNKTFNPAIGLQNGSIFPELISPYYPGQSMDFINYLRTNPRMGGM